jgi:sigma54-dependent transcription regulator
VIAATNKNLREAVKENAFRQDLYFRLNVIQIVLPPMRERPEDILPLARFFIEHYNRKFRRGIEGVSPAAGELLLALRRSRLRITTSAWCLTRSDYDPYRGAMPDRDRGQTTIHGMRMFGNTCAGVPS